MPTPVARYTSTSSYGMRRGKMHHGMDFFAAEGEPVTAIEAGTVIAANPDGERQGYGTTVIVDHGGVASMYSHLQDLLLPAVGSKVTAGQVIGRVGRTNSTRTPTDKSQVHFEALLKPWRHGTRGPVVTPHEPKRIDPARLFFA